MKTPAAIAAMIIAMWCTPASSQGRAVPRIKAVAFDYLVLFNADSVAEAADQVFPGRGRELTNLWRTRQFEYSWLRSIAGRYEGFLTVTEDALVYSAAALKLDLTSAARQRLLYAYLHLAPWPDTSDALRALKSAGLRVITLANFTPLMQQSNADNAGITDLFDALLSTDANRTYKPDPRAYRLGINALHLSKDEILFVASGGWDAAGAKSFGYPTYWVNRLNQPFEELGVRPDGMSVNLDGLLAFVLHEAELPATRFISTRPRMR
jgi:2-haloacid dehalogenase